MDWSKYDNVVKMSEFQILTLLAEYHDVNLEDMVLHITDDNHIEVFVGINEPEREATYASHY